MISHESRAAPRLHFAEDEVPPEEPDSVRKPQRKAPRSSQRQGESEGKRHDAPAVKAAETVQPENPSAPPPKKKSTVRSAALSFEEDTPRQPSKMKHKPRHSVSTLMSDSLHRETQHSNEDQNVSVTAVDQGIRVVEHVAHSVEDTRYSNQLRKHRSTTRAAAQRDALQGGNHSRLQHGVSANASPSANQAAASGQASAHTGSNLLSKMHQKHSIRKGYIAAKSGKTAGGTYQTARGTKQAVRKSASAAGKLGQIIVRRKSNLVLVLLAAMLAIMMSLISSCAPLAQSAITSATLGTYPAEEDDIRAAERAYSNMERDLQRELDRYEHYHPGCDEYHVEQDEIWHDPYALIAIISARFGGEEWTIDTAYPVLELYFDLQYDLEEEIVRRTRYDDEGNPYPYTICNVTLTNKDLSHQPVYSMSREQLGMYALYMSTLGNMPDLFSGAHCSQLRAPVIHDVPQEYLDADPNFALLITEANKYVGYPYVWGGDSPETSFDCSGFLSYVFTTTGVCNTGRLGARGLYGVCDPVAPEDARPGDMVFFEGTMGDDVGGITHCGLYVGDGWFIHCGNPIGYAELDDWRSHFYGFGRAY